MPQSAPLMLSVSGCRGIVGQSLTPEVIARFAGAYASWLIERAAGRPVTIVLGRDGRAGSHMVRAAAVAGITGAGVRVVDLGVAMTPTTAVMTDSYSRQLPSTLVAGMVLTASHNPQMWNGLKCLLAEGGLHGSSACAPPAEFATQIIERFNSAKPSAVAWDRLGALTGDASGADEHVDRMLGAIEDAGVWKDASTLGIGLKVAVDSVNSSGATGARQALEALGCEEILHLGSDESGIFPHPPEPTEENLAGKGGLCDAVREASCHVGFAQDPDADRLAIIDERGKYIGEEHTLALGALSLLEAERAAGRKTTEATLVTNLSTSRMIDDVAAKFGAKVVRTPVGEANVVETMKSMSSVAGGEGNGGVIWPRVAYVRDSLSAMALTLALLAREKKPLSAIVAAMPAYAIEKRKVEIRTRDDATPAIERIAKAHASAEVDRQDGVRVDWLERREWLHVRPSNTEPIMRLIAEAPTQARAKAILDEAATHVASSR